jgi:methyl-accepting chemotaxis protein
MTFAEISAIYGNYLWLALVAVATYFAMNVLKKSFTPVTKWLSSTAKGRRNANTILGAFMSVGFASILGAVCKMLVGTEVHFMWFVAAGVLANYAYLLKERFADAEKLEMAKAVADAIHESNKDIEEDDFPEITAKVRELTEAFKKSELNVHAKEVSGVATGIADAIGISQEEIDKVSESIETLKTAGIDVSSLESVWEACKNDGKVTPQERSIVMQACEILRRKYGK